MLRRGNYPLVPSMADYIDADEVYLAFTPTGVDVFEAVDASTVRLAFSPSGVDEHHSVDSGTVRLTFTVTATEGLHHVDSDTVNLVFTVAGDEQPHRPAPSFVVNASSKWRVISAATKFVDITESNKKYLVSYFGKEPGVSGS